MFEHPQLEALCAVVRLGSFDAAAAQLSVTPSAISQRIKLLEDRVGMILVERGQPCTATAAAETLIRHRDQVHLLETALTRDLGLGAQALAPVRIAVNADSLASWLLPALATVEGFLFDLKILDQDHTETLLKRGEVAAAISSRAQALQGCDCIALGALRYVATASPAFAARHFPGGVTRDALTKAPALTFDPQDRLQRDWALQVVGANVSLPTHYLANAQGFVDATCLGIGWGLNPEPMVRQHLKDGTLVALAPEHPFATPLYWHVSRLTAATIAPITSALRAVQLDTL